MHMHVYIQVRAAQTLTTILHTHKHRLSRRVRDEDGMLPAQVRPAELFALYMPCICVRMHTHVCQGNRRQTQVAARQRRAHAALVCAFSSRPSPSYG